MDRVRIDEIAIRKYTRQYSYCRYAALHPGRFGNHGQHAANPIRRSAVPSSNRNRLGCLVDSKPLLFLPGQAPRGRKASSAATSTIQITPSRGSYTVRFRCHLRGGILLFVVRFYWINFLRSGRKRSGFYRCDFRTGLTRNLISLLLTAQNLLDLFKCYFYHTSRRYLTA